MNKPGKKYRHLLLILFLFSLPLNAALYFSPSLDGLKGDIRLAQDSLQSLQQRQKTLEAEFNTLNLEIYEFKQALEKNNNPITQLRLSNALKSSRQFADRLELLIRRIRALEIRLQDLYRRAINAIDREIRVLLSRSGNPGDRRGMAPAAIQQLQTLEQDKTYFSGLLQNNDQKNTPWKQLSIDPGDSPQRIRMKTAILQDHMTRLEKSLKTILDRKKELQKDQKIYGEMLNFYLELNQAVDDEQEFFDRNRIDEQKDRLETLNQQIIDLDGEIGKIRADIELLNSKLRLFHSQKINPSN